MKTKTPFLTFIAFALAAPLFAAERSARGLTTATSSTDEGRFEVTRSPGDRGRFRVPTLRNVGETAPYFHDGSAATLGEAVSLEASGRPDGRSLSVDQRDDLVAFLRAGLTDLHAQPERPETVPSGLMVPADGYRIPR